MFMRRNMLRRSKIDGTLQLAILSLHQSMMFQHTLDVANDPPFISCAQFVLGNAALVVKAEDSVEIGESWRG